MPLACALLLPSCVTGTLWSENGVVPSSQHLSAIDDAALTADGRLYLQLHPGARTFVAQRTADGAWAAAVETTDELPPSDVPVRIVEGGVLWPPPQRRDGEFAPLLIVELEQAEGASHDQVWVIDTRDARRKCVRLPAPATDWDGYALRAVLTPVTVATDVVLLPIELIGFAILLTHPGH
jgi:hypothetical protein